MSQGKITTYGNDSIIETKAVTKFKSLQDAENKMFQSAYDRIMKVFPFCNLTLERLKQEKEIIINDILNIKIQPQEIIIYNKIKKESFVYTISST